MLRRLFRGGSDANKQLTALTATLLLVLLAVATGVALLALDRTHGPIVGLHKASFVVWVGAMALHVLTRAPTLLRALRRRVPGPALRAAVVGGVLATGLVLATVTLPAADHLQDATSAHVGIDAR
jgi:hypothetical protein